MGEVKRVASNLMQMLDGAQKEAQSLAGIMDELQSYLEEESQTIIEGSLDRLSSRIRWEAAKITGGSVVVLVSPEGRVTVDKTYSDEDSDPWLKRLKSQDFYILRPGSFSAFIKSLKSEVAEGNLISAIEFLRENR
jgi:mevalonate kinase